MMDLEVCVCVVYQGSCVNPFDGDSISAWITTQINTHTNTSKITPQPDMNMIQGVTWECHF